MTLQPSYSKDGTFDSISKLIQVGQDWTLELYRHTFKYKSHYLHHYYARSDSYKCNYGGRWLHVGDAIDKCSCGVEYPKEIKNKVAVLWHTHNKTLSL